MDFCGCWHSGHGSRQPSSAGTLEDARARGHLNCIVNTGLTGLPAQMMRAIGQVLTLNFAVQ